MNSRQNKKCVLLTWLPMKTKFEKKFWNLFVEECFHKGYEIIHIGNKMIDSPIVNNLFYARELDTLFIMNEETIKTIDDNVNKILEESVLDDLLFREVEFGQISKQIAAEYGIRILRYMESVIINLLNDYEISLIMTWTQLTPFSFIANRIGKKLNIQTFEAERAPLNDFIWIEKKGILNESAIWDMKLENMSSYRDIGKKIRKEILENVYGFRTPKKTDDSIPEKTTKRVFFVPMDNIYEAGWLPKEFSVSQKRFPSHDLPYVFLQKLKGWVGDDSLIIKPHPSCRVFDECKGDLEFTNADLKDLLEVSDVVICNYTKVAFVALAMRKKLILFAPNIAYLSGVCKMYSNIFDIEDSYIDEGFVDDYDERVESFFGWLAKEYFWSDNKEYNYIKDFVEKYL